jgi:hypothetical protein
VGPHVLRGVVYLHEVPHLHPNPAIYTKYRIFIRIPLEQGGYYKTGGFFDFKEHVSTIGLLMLPAYWFFWKNAQNPQYDSVRKWTTVVLCAMCWFLFIVGHVINNTRGFGS